MKRIYLVFLIVHILFACKKSEVVNPSIGSNSSSNVDIYGFGIYSNYPSYWKNGILTTLTGGRYGTYVSSIATSGNDIYMIANGEPAYWKNEIITTLIGGNYASFIAVLGNDVYVTGSSSNDNSQAMYWKNGIPTTLTGGSYASFITISDNDVYVAGTSSDVAVYWKNEIRTTLPGGDSEGDGYQATCIAVSGNDVYVTGTSYNNEEMHGNKEAIYWKNGILTKPAGGFGYWASFIAVLNNDLYVAGINYTNAAYWKNGTMTVLTTTGISSNYEGIFLTSNIKK